MKGKERSWRGKRSPSSRRICGVADGQKKVGRRGRLGRHNRPARVSLSSSVNRPRRCQDTTQSPKHGQQPGGNRERHRSILQVSGMQVEPYDEKQERRSKDQDVVANDIGGGDVMDGLVAPDVSCRIQHERLGAFGNPPHKVMVGPDLETVVGHVAMIAWVLTGVEKGPKDMNRNEMVFGRRASGIVPVLVTGRKLWPLWYHSVSRESVELGYKLVVCRYGTVIPSPNLTTLATSQYCNRQMENHDLSQPRRTQYRALKSEELFIRCVLIDRNLSGNQGSLGALDAQKNPA